MNIKILENSEIAKAISSLPVLHVDITKRDIYGMSPAFFKFDDGSSKRNEELRIYNDSQMPSVSERPFTIVNEMQYDDWMERIKFNNAPIIKNGSQFVLVLDNPTKNIAKFILLTMAKAPTSNNCYIKEFALAIREQSKAEFKSVLYSIMSYWYY